MGGEIPSRGSIRPIGKILVHEENRYRNHMRLFSMIIDRFFYNPYRSVAKCKNIRMGDSKLGHSFHVRFDCPRDGIALHIGDRCLLSNDCVFDSASGKITIGDGVFIGSGTTLISRSSIEIGNSVMISWGCVIDDHDSHSISYLQRIADMNQTLIDYSNGNMVANKDWSKVVTAPIKIRDYVWLGFDVVILKGVTIGEGAIVGARSVVLKDVPPWSIAMGNPARVIGSVPIELRKW